VGVDHRRRSAYPRLIAARLCLSFLLLVASAGPAATGASAAEPSSHLVLVVLENREYDEVVDNPEAPYLNLLAERGALATRYYGVAHPSLPNYLALLAGSTFGIAENCLDCVLRGANLATQLSRAGISWRAYMGGMPHRCFAGSSYGDYTKRHNPFAYFRSIAAVPARCQEVVPEARLLADMRRHRLPRFAWLSPDLCRDGHDCPLATADSHLQGLVPRILRQLGPHGLLVLTFDEGHSDAGGGGHVATILAGPGVLGGRTIRRPADHYSLLASIEDRFGLPRLRHARGATPLAPALFKATG
jgi:phosphatidylinositol-3-phosphatase